MYFMIMDIIRSTGILNDLKFSWIFFERLKLYVNRKAIIQSPYVKSNRSLENSYKARVHGLKR